MIGLEAKSRADKTTAADSSLMLGVRGKLGHCPGRDAQGGFSGDRDDIFATERLKLIRVDWRMEIGRAHV